MAVQVLQQLCTPYDLALTGWHLIGSEALWHLGLVWSALILMPPRITTVQHRWVCLLTTVARLGGSMLVEISWDGCL